MRLSGLGGEGAEEEVVGDGIRSAPRVCHSGVSLPAERKVQDRCGFLTPPGGYFFFFTCHSASKVH